MRQSDDSKLQERIRQRAYKIWEEEGRPEGHAEDHWDRAAELVAIEDNYKTTLQPVPDETDTGPTGEPVEPIEAVENAGEFPTMTDQGEQAIPSRKSIPGTRR